MVSIDSASDIGKSILRQIIKMEIIELDKFALNYEIQFGLRVMDMVYKIKVKPEGLDAQAITQIWTELFSSFMADYNKGLVTK